MRVGLSGRCSVCVCLAGRCCWVVLQLSALPPLTVRAPPGPHVVTAWLEGMPGQRHHQVFIPGATLMVVLCAACMPAGRSVLHRTVSAFTVLPAACTMALRIAQPRHGQHAFSASVPLLFTLHDPPQQQQQQQDQPPGRRTSSAAGALMVALVMPRELSSQVAHSSRCCLPPPLLWPCAGPPARRSSQEIGQELSRQGFSICFRFQYQDPDGRGSVAGSRRDAAAPPGTAHSSVLACGVVAAGWLGMVGGRCSAWMRPWRASPS